MPWPARLTRRDGLLILPSHPRIAAPAFTRVAELFISRLERKTAVRAELVADVAEAAIVFESAAGPEQEAYGLTVTSEQARLRASTSLGALRGAETLLQLTRRDPERLSIPALEVEDQARFRWRGVLIDPARHFLPVDLVKRLLDLMAAVKLNVLHWHLSDDQGFRMESRGFPRLHQFGSDGDFYRQDEVIDLIAYAADRAVRIVPEFDVPGHTTSWLVGYPWLGSRSGDESAGEERRYELKRQWGPEDVALDPTREEAYEFLDAFFGEMAALFPDPCFHIGGDEVSPLAWNGNPRIVAFMHERGISHTRDLQVIFNRRLSTILDHHGKRMVGWDEILHPDLPSSALVQSWRGQKFFADALQRHEAILSSGYYLDQLLPASYHYLIDPLENPDLTEDEKERIAGGEACLWGEYIGADNFDSRAWPRLAAVAERLWSPAELRDVDSLYRRLDRVSCHLEQLGSNRHSNYRRMLDQMIVAPNAEALESLEVLADVVEPVKFYDRAIARLDSSLTPLIRLVDVVHPESDVNRRFTGLVARFLAGDREATSEIRRYLESWIDHRKALGPVIANSPLLYELDPLSRNLARAGQAGLEALARIEAPDPPEQRWWLRQVSFLERAKTPQAELVLVILPAVRQLVDSAAGRG